SRGGRRAHAWADSRPHRRRLRLGTVPRERQAGLARLEAVALGERSGEAFRRAEELRRLSGLELNGRGSAGKAISKADFGCAHERGAARDAAAPRPCADEERELLRSRDCPWARGRGTGFAEAGVLARGRSF